MFFFLTSNDKIIFHLSYKLCLVPRMHKGKKNIKKNEIFIFYCLIKNTKNKINIIKTNYKLIFLKLFKVINKNNLLNLNLFFIFFRFSFLLTLVYVWFMKNTNNKK